MTNPINEVSEKDLEIAAQCWCDPRVSKREMDPFLATVFAEKLSAQRRQMEGEIEGLKMEIDQLKGFLREWQERAFAGKAGKESQ